VSRLLPAIDSNIPLAAELLRRGELVAFPTDTVYGVGAVVWNEAAAKRIFAAKLRPAHMALPVLLADESQMAELAPGLTEGALRLARIYWPGALTLVVPCSPQVPAAVTANGHTVGLRIPAHPFVRALIRAVGAPLATTSANLSGHATPITAAAVAEQLGDRLALLLDGGPCEGGVASTVVDLTGDLPMLLRAGPISLELIRSVFAG
jgi:L-threonylcarbamoyladenylate synthase